MSNQYQRAILSRAMRAETLFRIAQRRLDAAERKLEKQRRKNLKNAYKLGHMEPRESTWEANFKLAIEYRKQLQVPTKDRDFWISQAKYYITEAWLARAFPVQTRSLNAAWEPL